MPALSRLGSRQGLAPQEVCRLKYVYCVVLRVHTPSMMGAVLSRFVSESDKGKAEEGREKAEEVLQSLRNAGLTLRVKKHVSKDGSKLLMVFVTANMRRLELQSQRLYIERWLQEEGRAAHSALPTPCAFPSVHC